MTPILAVVVEPFNWNNFILLLLAAVAAWTAYRDKQKDKEREAQKTLLVATKEIAEKTSVKADETALKVDGAASEARNEIKNLREQIAALLLLKAEAKETAAVLASTHATAAPAIASSPSPVEVTVVNPVTDPVPTVPARATPKK